MKHFRHLKEKDIFSTKTFLNTFKTSSLFLLSNLERAGIEDHGERFQGLWYASFDGEQMTGVAAHFWNDNILMQCPDEHTSCQLLDALLDASPRPLGGLIGPWPQLERATAHLGVRLDTCAYASKEPLYELDTSVLRDPFLESDTMAVRLATLEDLDLLTSWMWDYDKRLDPDAKEERVRHNTRAQIVDGATWLLEDTSTSTPLATTSTNARVGDTFQIGGVWTPVHLRGKGYARRVVAGQIEAMRTQGFTRVMLFTGEDNIPAQRAYTSLGFVHTQDYGLILGIPESAE